jgi:hypothetical protein
MDIKIQHKDTTSSKLTISFKDSEIRLKIGKDDLSLEERLIKFTYKILKGLKYSDRTLRGRFFTVKDNPEELLIILTPNTKYNKTGYIYKFKENSI